MRPSSRLAISRAAGWLVGAACLLFAGRLDAQEASASTERPAGSGSEGRGEAGREDQGGESAEKPGLLDPIFDPIDPARLQRAFDRWLGLDSGNSSGRPKAPEIPEPVFFDVVRPLGDLKYANELNYLFNPSTRNAPTLQVIEYEYVIADWRSVELDLSYYNGDLQVLTPFYQRTLGVGPRRNWVHGYQLSLDLYLRTGFVGASPVYVFSWKPEEESRFSTTFFVGANRARINGFDVIGANSPRGPDRPFGAWRPTFNADFFYKLSERWVVGIEDDLFFGRGRAGEYLAFPFVTYEAGEHAFFQVGGGYYRFESRDQFTLMAHVNLVNPSRRRAREPERASRESESSEPREGGRSRGWINRLVGDR